VSFRRLEEITPVIYAVSVVLLVLTLFFGSGPAGRWLSFGPVHIQTSELAKAALILMTSWWLSSLKVKPRKYGEGLVFLTVIPAVILTALQPDLGTAVSMMMIILAMFVWAGYGLGWIFLLISPLLAALSSMHFLFWLGFTLVMCIILYHRKYPLPLWITFIGGNSIVAALTPGVWNMLEPYQQSRLITFLNPANDPHGSGWNIIQSEVAIGSGGFSGQGYLQGAQKELAFLPARHTDFVFSVWAEEMGFIGCLVLLAAFFLLFWRVVAAARKSVNPFNSLVVAGVGAYIGIHVFVNIGMTLGIMPVTGLPLPFISYGGSQLVVIMFLLGLVLNAGMYWREV
ncbi:MAG: rod shape-determining protein RodA, partial [Candidatus Aegiribacteria sp.]|nr:rod shape-determining protein RodA [Candidatus Aegiribacteria sp.]MBD3294871.1 rod shape-determining protein RodA [Candidatus Fermentibacteria bacterium]